MEFFGITLYGPQNYIKDIMIDHYFEPITKEDAKETMKNISLKSVCKNFEHSVVDKTTNIDCYLERVDGFAYGSMQRLIKMKKKGLTKPVGPLEMYRLPPTTSIEYGWWLCEPALEKTSWYVTSPRHPQPTSPNTLILDQVRKNNKYASLF